MNKPLKPNLVDPIFEKKIIKTLNPTVQDYWAPTKTGLKYLFQNFIRPNILLIIFLIIIALLLFYRYQVVKNNREIKKLEQMYSDKSNINIDVNTDINNSVDKYKDVLLYLYNQQKETMREPKTKKKHNITDNFAYPVYPYKGSLSPSK
ncbi:hypothetical protein [Acanthamoeba polyphaga mimivirus]|uniref:Uncharacterized protein n=5 Tax=Megamimivirinae TaxID=3044648 RepID=A0A2L2DJI0_MIMIV|nr:hypothetical protein MegaChil _gp0596 [Megavirus chiliensis]AEX61776.1 hypothetical protein c7_R713 [Megavirus courdo7]AFX92673.1 hypothetical protein CE11_00647 [Megavirus courdo11]AUV58540.1 hypothetical protein [Bandra megavirus]AVG46322.1 hypothetical protein [Acanthamoeba polyphaga mimivirus]AVL93919.1 hypothetical protein mvi_559 [Megavirus vitis]